MSNYITVTHEKGTFGGGEYPVIEAQVVHISLNIPEGCHVIGGKLYRQVYDPDILKTIRYPDGSSPTTCALLPVDDTGELLLE